MSLLNRAQNVGVSMYLIVLGACLGENKPEIQDIAIVAIAIVKLITGLYNLRGLC